MFCVSVNAIGSQFLHLGTLMPHLGISGRQYPEENRRSGMIDVRPLGHNIKHPVFPEKKIGKSFHTVTIIMWYTTL